MTDKEEFRQVIREAGDLEREALPPEAAFPPVEIPEIRVRHVLTFLFFFYLTAVLLRIFVFEGPSLVTLLKSFRQPGIQVGHHQSILFDFFLYMTLACQFLPLPTLPPIAFAAKAFNPILVSFVATFGTCIAYLNDYVILGVLFRYRKVRKIRDANVYRRLLRFFDRYAFITLAAASFLPIPVDVIRLLAISRAYSFSRYLLATFVGRLPRYLIIAYLGKELPIKYILVIFGLTILPAGVKIVSAIIKKRKKR